MSIADYLLNSVLVLLVIRQIRGRRLTTRQLVLPLVIVAWAASHYLRGVPTAGNDLLLVMAGVSVGLLFGIGSGFATRLVNSEDGVPIATATGLAAALWVLGIGARMGFALYAQNGGADAIARFSAAHGITGGEAWVAALVLMSLVEVVSRTIVLGVRSGVIRQLVSPGPTPSPAR
jgi:hypothetical protein